MFLEFYKLREQPFGVTPDPRFLYMGGAYEETFRSLVRGIETGCGFMAMVAAPGLGKTTLLLRLMAKLQDSALTAFLFQTHTNSQEFLKNLLHDLDVEPKGQDLSDLQHQLQDVLMVGSQSGKRLVLVIDEAQSLDDPILEMIRMLSNFETPRTKLLQIVLAGQPALAEKLLRPHLAQLRQRLSVITHLRPLRGEEVNDYIRHRLDVAGYTGGSLFTTAAMRLIAQQSDGAPRVINNLCLNAMSLGCAGGQKQIGEEILREVIKGLNLHHSKQDSEPPRTAAVEHSPAPRTVIETPQHPVAEAREAGLNQAANRRESQLDADLDEVDILERKPEESTRARRAQINSSPGAAVRRRGFKRELQVAALWAAAGILLGIWCTPRLKPSWDFLVSAMRASSDVPANSGGKSVRSGSDSAPPTSGVQDPRSEGPGEAGDHRDPSAGAGDGTQAEDSPAPLGANSAASSNPGLGEPMPAVSADISHPQQGHISHERGRTTNAPSARKIVDDLGAQGSQGELIVESSDSGARVSLNGRSDTKWVTPHLFLLASGTYVLSVSKQGYATWTRRLYVDQGRKNWIMASLTPDDGTGILIVDTDPPGMPVFIDGKPRGVSHMETVLGSGWHVCEVFPGQGYKPVTHEFHLLAGEILTKKIRIDSVMAPTPATTIIRRAQEQAR